MKKTLLLTALGLTALTGCTELKKEDIGPIVAEYLVENPEFLIEAGKNLQKKEQEKAQAAQINSVLSQKTALIDEATPYIGNAEGKVAVIEFFDYQCTYCVVMSEHMKSLVQENSDVKVYLKETPIFGSRSEPSKLAAEWGMEIFAKKGTQAYESYHNALWSSAKDNGNKLSNDVIKEYVEKSGLTFSDVTATMTKKPQANIQLFSQLGFRGTPALIVMPTEGANKDNVSIIAGADVEGLKAAIEKARG
ncbi:DsbA family protein [Vibrio paucivorans]|uniref:DsbA family protein n=1 Tax=Vibrio paucivorans TaxID=2829489 RepID=A0A9X3CI83_9VIBR|nr:DsbA family protein [Vibrio paucivorans]MCW8336378.1 DsbA family protein [Vibrio paucivorans]